MRTPLRDSGILIVFITYIVIKQVNVEVVLTNLVRGVYEQLHHKVDVLMFNPPYVPTPSEEIG